ncbi:MULTISPECIES: hypothetical protein [unclassified Streptomyces]|uniref:hypothetical protein n=1 Tax=unclassified Streptomyces TaxID=2593676 RepID=UPI000A771CE3
MDRPRSGALRRTTDEEVEALVASTLGQTPPTGDSHWSTRSMAQATDMSQSAVSRIWRAFGLEPHIVQTWKLSPDPQFVTEVRDVVGYATHKTEPVKKWLLRHPRFRLHFTPTSASWLNLVERWSAELTCRKLRRSAHRSVVELERDIRGSINEWNKNPKRSSERRPPTTSSIPSPHTAHKITTQDTRLFPWNRKSVLSAAF